MVVCRLRHRSGDKGSLKSIAGRGLQRLPPGTFLYRQNQPSKGKKMAEIFAAIDLTAVVAAVVVIGVAVMGIQMAFKGIDLGKRGVKKV